MEMPSAADTRILLVEDDLKLAQLVREYLQQQGYVVEVESSGDDAVTHVLAHAPDLIILDLMLPGLDGLSVCRQVRPHYAGPIMMLTAKGEDLDEVVGLEVGADDYMVKPVRPRVLLARIRTLLRRVQQDEPSQAPTRIGALTVDPTTRIASLHGQPILLTTAEFDLLWLLARHPGQPLSRDRIYRELRGIPHDGVDRSIDLRVSHLRTKLGDDARNPARIKSVRGVGYLLAEVP